MNPDFKAPKILNAVRRPRLFRLLDDNAWKKNVLVTGQAAQGKSTLVASYLETRDRPAAWLHLGSQENDDTKLFEKLLAALDAADALPVSCREMLLPRSTLGVKTKGIRQVEALTSVFGELAETVTIVLDDLQNMDETAPGFLLIRRLLDLDAAGLRLFLLSRTRPGFDLARMQMQQRIFVMENEVLAFTHEEIRKFFSRTDPDPFVDIGKIRRITEGWAGGLALVSESIRQLKDQAHLPDRLSADVFSFFSQEIYHRLDAPVRDFLMTAAVLETVDLGAVNHLTGSHEGNAVLSGLEKRNLFIHRIPSDTAEPRFRFHDLFRNFLLSELVSARGSTGVRELNRRAGNYFWDQKDHEQAVQYYIQADSFPDIVRIIRIKGTDYLIKGKLSEPERWIGHLPEDMIEADPWLLFFKAMTRRIRDGKKNMSRLEKALAMFDHVRDLRGCLLCTGFLIEAAVFIRLPSPRILAWIRKGEALLDEMRSSQRYPWARALLWQQIGLGYIAGDGNIPKGISASRNAILLARQIRNTELVVNATITMTFGHVQAGDFARARQMLARIEQVTPRGRHPEYRALKGIVDIELALKNADFESAGRLLAVSEEEIEKFGLIFLYPAFVEEKAMFLVFTSQYDDARRTADHLNDFSILEGNDFYSGISHRIMAMADLYQAAYVSGLERITRATAFLDKDKKGDIHHFQAKLIQGVLLYLNQSFEEAEASLRPALAYFTAIASDLSASETAVALGLALWDLGDTENAARFLEQGFEKICRNQYRFFPVLTGPMVSLALVRAAALKPETVADRHLLFLISRVNRPTAIGQIRGILEGLKKKEQIEAKENLRPLYKQLLPKIKISSLGRFAVQCKDASLAPVLFEGSRPVLLLKAIVLHGARDIPKEILIDDLWPESGAASGEKNFKITLHRLRKAIEPSPDKAFGYSYILQKSGLVSLDPDLVRMDTDLFMALAGKGFALEGENRQAEALDCLLQAAGVYKGDYFAEEPYAEWIHRKRDLYRSRYLEILEKTAFLQEELDQTEPAIDTWKAVLRTDPCYEEAYRNLMILYADAGRKGMAFDVYEDCKRVLESEVGTGPDRRTTAVYESVRRR